MKYEVARLFTVLMLLLTGSSPTYAQTRCGVDRLNWAFGTISSSSDFERYFGRYRNGILEAGSAPSFEIRLGNCDNAARTSISIVTSIWLGDVEFDAFAVRINSQYLSSPIKITGGGRLVMQGSGVISVVLVPRSKILNVRPMSYTATFVLEMID